MFSYISVVMSYKGCKCSVVMCSDASLCLTVCNAPTFENYDPECSSLVWFTSSESSGEVRVSRHVFLKSNKHV